MAHTVYISFKTENATYKEEIQGWRHIDYIDKSLNTPINSENPDYVLQRIRSEYLSKSTVTIFLIGTYSAEALGEDEQYYIKKELQASLYDATGNTKNGILGVVLPGMESMVYGGKYGCLRCGGSHSLVRIGDDTAITEFSYNYYIPHGKCSWLEEDRYCVLAKWDEFRDSPNDWIDQAFDKRAAPITSKTKVRP